MSTAEQPRAVRDAATVILIREAGGGAVEFHAVRRPSTLRAFAGFWAFPGGSVDAQDRDPAWAGLLAPMDVARATEIAVRRERSAVAVETVRFRARMRAIVERFIGGPLPDDPVPDAAADPAANLAVWVTAIREAFEETGMLLAGGGPATRPQAGDLAAMRVALRGGGVTFLAQLTAAGLRPDLSALRYMGRLLTPSTEPRRFDTRFFLARVAGALVDPSGGAEAEVAEAGWFQPAEALARNAAGDFPLAPPSRFVLETIAAYPRCEALWGAFA